MSTTETNLIQNTLNQLSELMTRHGAVIRAIPQKKRHLYEKELKSLYPDGKIEYVDEFKREMLVQYTAPQNAGKFYLTFANHTMQTVIFNNSLIFDSLEEITEYLVIQNAKKQSEGYRLFFLIMIIL